MEPWSCFSCSLDVAPGKLAVYQLQGWEGGAGLERSSPSPEYRYTPNQRRLVAHCAYGLHDRNVAPNWE